MRRRARGVLLLLIAPAILYWLGANFVLDSGLAEYWINGHPDRVDVHWRVAWTVWPGTVHLRGFRLVSQDDHQQMELVIDRATTDVEPGPAMERRFQADRVLADGVEYRLRTRPRDHRERLRLAAVEPPIEGLENTVVRRTRAAKKKATTPVAAASPAPPRHRRRPWSVHLSGVVVSDVRQIWIDEHRLEGGAIDAGGAFEIEPHRRVWMDAQLHVTGGTVTLGKTRELDDLNATLAAKLHGFDPRRARGRRALRFLEASVDATARMHDASFAGFYLRRVPWLALSGGAGPITGQLGVARGHVVPGSHVDARARDLRARFLGDEAVGSGTLSWSAGDDGSRLVATLTRFVLRDPADRRAYMRGRHLSITATNGGLSITRPIERDLDVALAVPEASIPDFSYYQRYVPASAGLTIAGGSAIASGRLDWSSATRRAKGQLSIVGRDVSARWGSLTLGGRFTLHTIVPSSDAALRRLDIAGTSIALDDVAITGKGAPRGDDGWWGRAVVLEGTVSPGAPQWLDARVSASLRDSAPLVALFSRNKPLPAPAQAALTVDGLDADATLSVGGSGLLLAPLTVRARDLDLRLDLALSQGRRLGALYVKRGPFSTALELDGDETKIHLLHPKDWFLDREGSVYAPSP